MSVCQKIKSYLKAKGIKQNYMAEKLGICKARMTQILQSDNSIKIDRYIQICRLLNVDIDFFIN